MRLTLFWMALFFVPVASAEVPGVIATYPSGTQAGQSTRLIVYGSIGTAPTELWCDRPDLTVQTTDKPNEWTITAPADARPGVAWLRWHNAEGASDLRPFIVGQLPEIVETEPNHAAKDAQKIAALPVLINGRLDKRNEVDTFAVTLKAGETLVAWIQANSLLPSPMDASLQITDSRGFVIEQNEDWIGNDPRVVWTAPSDGTWHVRAFAFPVQTDSSINYAGGENYVYRLSLTTGPVLDHVVPLVKQAGAVIPHGWNLPEGPLEIVGEPSQLRLGTLAHVARVVPAFPFEALPEPVGAVSVEAPAAPSTVMAIPGSMTGRIDVAGDGDLYSFTATKGQVLRIRTISRRLGSLVDPRVRVLKADGTSLTDQDDEGEAPDPNFTWTVPEDGVYSLEVTDRYAAGGPHHFYLLQVQPEVPGFELSVAANRFTLDRTKLLEIPVTITRTAGLNVPIQFTLEGLPAGVTLEPVESKPEGDSSKAITLKLTVAAEAAAARGPIRIVGHTTVPDLQRSATAPIDGVKATTTSVWMTLGAK